MSTTGTNSTTPSKQTESKMEDSTNTPNTTTSAAENGLFASRHADPDFKVPEKGEVKSSRDMSKDNKASSPTNNGNPLFQSRHADPSFQPEKGGNSNKGSNKYGRGGWNNKKKGGNWGRSNGQQGARPSTSTTAEPKSTKYPGKTAIKEADYQAEFDKKLTNLKLTLNVHAHLAEFMEAWVRGVVVLMPDGSEVLAAQYNAATPATEEENLIEL